MSEWDVSVAPVKQLWQWWSPEPGLSHRKHKLSIFWLNPESDKSKCTIHFFTTEGQINTFQVYKTGILWEHLWRKNSLLSSQHWWCQAWNTVLSYGLPSTREKGTHWAQCSEGLLKWLYGASPLWRKAERAWAVCSAWRRLRGELINACKYLEGDAKKAEPGSFQCAPTRPEAIDTKWNAGGSV